MRNFVTYQSSVPFRVWDNASSWSTNYKTAPADACKQLVTDLLAMVPSLVKVSESMTEESGGYKAYTAYLKVSGTEVGFRIRNMLFSLLIADGVFDANDQFSTGSDSETSLGNFFGYYYQYGTYSDDWMPYLRAAAVGEATSILKLGFYSTRAPSCIAAGFGRFSSSGRNGFTGCTFPVATYSKGSFDELPSFTLTPGSYTMHIKSAQSGEKSTASFLDVFKSHDTAIAAALVPQSVAAYSGSQSDGTYLNIKWGGEYTLYRLHQGSTGSDGRVTAAAGATVTVDGVALTSCGSEILAAG